MHIDDFFDEALADLEQSFREEGLDITPDTLRSIAIGWCVQSSRSGPKYYRVTMDSHAGRRLIELFSRLTDLEEEEMINESANRK